MTSSFQFNTLGGAQAAIDAAVATHLTTAPHSLGGGGGGGSGGGSLNTVASATQAALSTAHGLAGVPHIPAGMTISVTSNLTLSKPVSFGNGARVSVAAGITLTLGGILAAPGQQVFTTGYTGMIRLTRNRFDRVPATWWLDETRSNDNNYDCFPELRKAIHTLSMVNPVMLPVFGDAYPTVPYGGTIELPVGQLWGGSELLFYNGVVPVGQGRVATQINALNAAFNMRAYDPRGNERRDIWRDFAINGRNVANLGVLMERGTSCALENMQLSNSKTNVEFRGAQQATMRSVDVLNTMGGSYRGVVVDRSTRNLLIDGECTVKNQKEYGVYITQSAAGASDGGSADTVTRPSRVTLRDCIIESNGLHNIVIDAGVEVLIDNGQISAAGNGIIGDPQAFRPQVRIAGRVEPPGNVNLNRVNVEFRGVGLNGGGSNYAIDARAYKAVDSLDRVAGDALVLGGTVTATAKPAVNIHVSGVTVWNGQAALALVDDRADLSIGPDVKPLLFGYPWIAQEAGAVRDPLEAVVFRGGLLNLHYSGAIGQALDNQIQVPPGRYTIVSHWVETPIDVVGTALVVDMKRKRAAGTTASIWPAGSCPTVAIGATTGKAGVPTVAQAVLITGDRLAINGAGTVGAAGQLFTGTLTLRAQP